MFLFNPLTSPGEGVTVFISPYLSAVAPALGEAKGLKNKAFTVKHDEKLKNKLIKNYLILNGLN